jgi:arylsulfatase A-like enzyme
VCREIVTRRGRRVLHVGVALAFALTLAAACERQTRAPAAARVEADHRLNVVVILADDARAGLAGMPNVRRLLARRGITFSRFFATTPECCPSRAGILSGQYSHHSGVVGNSGPDGYPRFDEDSNLAVWLHNAGYETALVGKYLNGYPFYGGQRVPPGWSDWQAIDSSPLQRYYDYVLNENGLRIGYGRAPTDYSTTVLTRKAVDFLAHVREPFFLYFAPIAPHLPATPAPEDVGTVRPRAPTGRPSFNERHIRDKPWWRSHSRRLRPKAIQFLEQAIARQRESLRAVDRSVGEIIATLKDRGLLRRTVILYASDNGFLWGEHRLGGKIWPYEESIRVPLVVRVPWSDVWGRTDRHLVLNIDLASTIAELAGVRPGLPQDGRSIVPLLHGLRPTWRSAFVVEYLGETMLARGGPPPFRALRSLRYLYVEYRNGWRELYDLVDDPAELRNVARDPGSAATRLQLASRLSALFEQAPRAP